MVHEEQADDDDLVEREAALAMGEPVMFSKVMLSKKEPKHVQRRQLFQTICKSIGKCCKVIIDSGNINNLVSEEMIQKLGLRRLKQPCPHGISWF